MSTKTKQEKPGTTYVVLERTTIEGGDTAWIEVESGLGTSKDDAIKRLVGTREGAFKAVPFSSWKGGRVQAQTSLIDSKPLEV